MRTPSAGTSFTTSFTALARRIARPLLVLALLRLQDEVLAYAHALCRRAHAHTRSRIATHTPQRQAAARPAALLRAQLALRLLTCKAPVRLTSAKRSPFILRHRAPRVS